MSNDEIPVITAMQLEIHLATQGGGTNFMAHLYRLIAKADIGNREKLRKGFPHEVAAWELYLNEGPEAIMALSGRNLAPGNDPDIVDVRATPVDEDVERAAHPFAVVEVYSLKGNPLRRGKVLARLDSADEAAQWISDNTPETRALAGHYSIDGPEEQAWMTR